LTFAIKENTPILDCELYEPVDVEESSWIIDEVDGQRTVIFGLIKKNRNTLWEHFCRQPDSANSAGSGTAATDSHGADGRILELAQLPEKYFTVTDIGSSWENYFECRGVTPQNVVACTGALSVPLTILKAIDMLGLSFELGDDICIDIPGSRVLELANMDLVYAELGRAFPEHDIYIRLIGPELGKGLGGDDMIGNALQVRNVTITLHRQLYQEVLANDDEWEVPGLAVLFHPSMELEFESWKPALQLMMQRRVPAVVTGYSLSDISVGLRNIKRLCDPAPRIMHEGLNPFACREQLAIDGSTESVSLLPKTSAQFHPSCDLDSWNARVSEAGGLVELLDKVDRHAADAVSINCWWYLIQA